MPKPSALPTSIGAPITQSKDEDDEMNDADDDGWETEEEEEFYVICGKSQALYAVLRIFVNDTQCGLLLQSSTRTRRWTCVAPLSPASTLHTRASQ